MLNKNVTPVMPTRLIALLAVCSLGLISCGSKADNQATLLKPQEISSKAEIARMKYTDKRLNTGKEWAQYFSSHGYKVYDPHEAVIDEPNGLRIEPTDITLGPPWPETGTYSRRFKLALCTNAEWADPNDIDVCANQSGIFRIKTVRLGLEAIKIWSCAENWDDPESTSISQVTGHAFLKKSNCRNHGGERTDYSYIKAWFFSGYKGHTYKEYIIGGPGH